MHNSGKNMLTVEKIGGTSMSAFGDVLRHIMLHDKSRIYGRIYVVSAYSGVTNQLLDTRRPVSRASTRCSPTVRTTTPRWMAWRPA